MDTFLSSRVVCTGWLASQYDSAPVSPCRCRCVHVVAVRRGRGGLHSAGFSKTSIIPGALQEKGESVMIRNVSVIAILCVLLCVCSTEGSHVVFEFAGELTNIEDPGFHFNHATNFTGSFEFDSETADSNNDPSIGEYRGVLLNMNFGGTQIETSTVVIHIFDDEPVPYRPWDIWDRIVVEGVGETPDQIDIQYFGLGMIEQGSAWFNNDQLPLELDWDLMQDLDDSAEISVSVHFPDGDAAYATGNITELTPEPACLYLLGIGSLVLFRRQL